MLRLHALVRWVLMLGIAGQCLGAAPARAQISHIALDGSLPHGRVDVIADPASGPSPGASYLIGEEFGWRSGSNLFHSFAAFDIATGESATFTADAALPALSHVIARVTSGAPSEIDGVIRSQIGTADVYLLNPHGVLFGGNSGIDVPGSFFVSTAHEVDFAGGGASLDLLDKDSPVLSQAAPEAFGFLSAGPRGEVVFSNPAGAFDVREYVVPTGETLAVAAGDVRIENRVRLRATSGRIELAATGNADARIPLDFAMPLELLGDADDFGEIRVSERSEVLTTTSNRNASQGTIVIRGGRFALAAGSVARAGDATRVDSSGNPAGPAIDIAVSRDVDISGANTVLRADSPGSRQSGDLSIRAGEIVVRDQALVQTRIDGDRTAGALSLAADEIRVESSARVSSLATRSGAGGDVVLTADRVVVASGSQIQSFAGAPGAGGAIEIHAGTLEVADGRIGSEGSATGPAGDIVLDALQLEVRGAAAKVNTLEIRTSAPPPETPSAPAGAIRIGSLGKPADSVVVAEGGLVSAETNGPHAGGGIEIVARTLEIEGGAAGTGASPIPSTIQTLTSGPGSGGGIDVHAERIALGPSTGSGTGSGTPGATPGRLTAFVSETGSGAGGGISIHTDTLLAEGGGQISTTTKGAGSSGPVTITATDSVRLTGSTVLDGFRPSGVFSRSDGAGDGGDVTITAPVIEVLEAAGISSRADGTLATGDAGDVSLLATDSIRITGAVNAASVTARGKDGRAGSVTLAGPEVGGVLGSVESVELLAGGIVDVSAGASDGGFVFVRAHNLHIAGKSGTGIPSGLGAEAVSTGNAGGIEVEVSGRVRIEDGGELNAITRVATGAAGDIRVAAREIEIRGSRATASSDRLVAAGSIQLAATDSIQLLDGAELAVRSTGGADAGSLTLTAPRIVVRDSSLVAEADGFGGNIDLETDRLVLERASLSALSRGIGTGDSGGSAVQGEGTVTGSSVTGSSVAALALAGGNISMDGGAIVLNKTVLNANGSGSANGGGIDITADPWLRSGDSTITASSEFGLEGFVIVNTPYGEVTGDLAVLPASFLDASSLLETPCLARDAPSGSFAVHRLGRVPPPPGAPLSAEAAGVSPAAAKSARPLECTAP